MFKINNLTYKHILNIDHIAIGAGEITSIVGPSGSGKTTLLKLFNKLISATSGELIYKGQSLAVLDSVAHRREVMMLPQQPAIYSGTIRENLLIGFDFCELPTPDDATLTQILSRVHLTKALDESTLKLSGGETQRLALARLLLLKPEVLLLDEPSSALDDDTEQLIIKAVVDYVKSNHKTLIMVTHSKRIATSYSEHIIELINGRVKRGEL